MAYAGRYLIPFRRWAASLGLLAAAGLGFPAWSAPVPELSVTFTVFSAAPIDGLAFTPRPEGSPAPVLFYPTARSPRYEYRGSNPLRFYRRPSSSSSATDEPHLAAEVLLTPGLRNALLLFVPVARALADGPDYRVYVLDDGPASHAPNRLLIVNFSGLPLAGEIGNKPVVLRDGLNPSLAVGSSAKITLRTLFRGRSYQSYEETVELGQDERSLLLLFPPYRAGSLEVQSRLLVDAPAGRVRGD